MHTYPPHLSNPLSAILGQGHFEAYFQPKFTLDYRLAGVETLARWHRKDGRLLTPGEFLPACIDLGQTMALTQAMAFQAIHTAACWQARQGAPLSVAINLPPHCVNAIVLDYLRQTLRQHGVSHQQIIIEILEDALEQPTDTFLAALEAFRQEGFRISIDDFGTGTAGLRRLVDFEAHEVKIASYFVKGVGKDARKATLIQNIIAMAEQLGMDTVLEGLEERSDLAWISHIKSPRVHLQGFILARPMSSHDLLLGSQQAA